MGYKNRESKDGSLSVRIFDADLADKIRTQCKMLNQSPSDYVAGVMEQHMKNAYSEYLKTLPKEDLIKLIMEKEGA